MAIKANSTITLVQVNDGRSAYEDAVAGGYTGTYEQFMADLALAKDLPEIKQRVTYHDAEITAQGLVITEIIGDEYEDGRLEVAERKITQIEAGEIKLYQGEETLADMLARMSQQISSLEGGGGNLMQNTNFGTYDDPDGYFWSSNGLDWLAHEARFPSWAAFETVGMTWAEYEANSK